MKIKKIIAALLLTFLCFTNTVSAQADRDSTEINTEKTYIIITYNGGEFIGKIIKQDDKEVTIETKDRGKITIPKYEVKEMRLLESGEVSNKGEYIPEEIFATRYFITSNGLSIKKGENYVLWSLYGPEVQFGVGENLSLGIMTSWVGIPIIGTAKYSIKLGENSHLGIGTLLGTGSWAQPDLGLAMPFGTLTIGNRRSNISFAGGYGAVWYDQFSEGRPLFSIGGMAKIGKKVSFVFDSFIVPDFDTSAGIGQGDNTVALFVPGIRIQGENNRAFQFGFAGIYLQEELAPFPIPMIQWFRKF